MKMSGYPAPAAFTLENNYGVHKIGGWWDWENVWMSWKRKKSLALARLRDYIIDTFQLIALYTLWPTLCVSYVNRNLVALTYYFTVISLQISQGCTNPGHSVVLASKFSTALPNICGPLVWNFLQVTLLAFRILRWVPDCLKISWSLQISIREQLPSPVKQIWYKCGVKFSTNTAEILLLPFFPLICKQWRSTEHPSVRTVHLDNVDSSFLRLS